MMDYYKKECDCGAEIQIPDDGEKHDAECPKCNLTMVCDESGDILKFIEQVRKPTDKPTIWESWIQIQRMMGVGTNQLTDLKKDFSQALTALEKERNPVSLCFHATMRDRVESIQKRGLLPDSDPSYFKSKTPYVMLSEKPWWDLHGNDTVVFAVTDPAIKREYFEDPEGLRWPNPIEPCCIHIIVAPDRTALEKERDEFEWMQDKILEMTDTQDGLHALADHYPKVVEALGELVGHIPVWMNNPHDTRGDWIRETLTTAQALLPSVSSGQGDSADTKDDEDYCTCREERGVGPYPCQWDDDLCFFCRKRFKPDKETTHD